MKFIDETDPNNIDPQDIYKVVIYPFGSLREVAQPYTEEEFGEELLEVGKKMLLTMYADEGIGLAANQVDLLKRIFVMDTSEDHSDQRIFINPEIIDSSGHACIEEGCLSVPDVRAPVNRKEKITLKYQDWQGNEHVEDFDGLSAICIQHELDHLNGVMFFDHLPPLQRDKALKKLKKWKRKFHV